VSAEVSDLPAVEAESKLPPDVIRISLPTPFAVGDVNVYLLRGPEPTLIDTGPRTAEALAALERGLADAGVAVETLHRVIVTHQHHDHAGLAADLRRRSGAELVVMSPLDGVLRHFDEAMERDDQFAVATMLQHGIEAKHAECLRALSRAVQPFGTSAIADRVLDPGTLVQAGARTLRALPRPGHTPTDTVFLDERDGLLFAGDHLLERVSSNPIAVCPLHARNPTEAARARETSDALRIYIDSLIETDRLEVEQVLPGHGLPFVWQPHLIARRLEMHSRRAATIAELLAEPRTAAAIVDHLWPDLALKELYLGISDVLGHLHLLIEDGRVLARRDGLGVHFLRAPRAQSRPTDAIST
jgi:glyoxylase-like metal-dependent hydrolase (beta-lactamase superfamily II)